MLGPRGLSPRLMLANSPPPYGHLRRKPGGEGGSMSGRPVPPGRRGRVKLGPTLGPTLGPPLRDVVNWGALGRCEGT